VGAPEVDDEALTRLAADPDRERHWHDRLTEVDRLAVVGEDRPS
jgi:hypothetical protein